MHVIAVRTALTWKGDAALPCEPELEREDLCEAHEVDFRSVEKAKESLPNMGYVAELFRAMGDSTRLAILYLLWKDPWCVHDLATILDTSVSNVSHHLRLLRTMRLVKATKEGRKVVYSLDDDHVEALMSEAFTHAGHS
ncbi:MAG TPA: winged helix-turn-helix transcriptional regulator [Firmicutes bacterium]|nr:winged helix-turn-helix transcriptional regulator [Candidatus Fermentithermobacillaceae bacterium]